MKFVNVFYCSNFSLYGIIKSIATIDEHACIYIRMYISMHECMYAWAYYWYTVWEHMLTQWQLLLKTRGADHAVNLVCMHMRTTTWTSNTSLSL